MTEMMTTDIDCWSDEPVTVGGDWLIPDWWAIRPGVLLKEIHWWLMSWPVGDDDDDIQYYSACDSQYW